MTNRWIGIASLVAMLAANTALVMRDLVPGWTAGTRPDSSFYLLKPGHEVGHLMGMYDADGERVGESWTVATRSSEVLSVRVWTLLERGRIGVLEVPHLRIVTDASFDTKRRLSALRIRVTGVGTPLELVGELIEPNDFSCRWKIGEREGNFVLPADSLATFSDCTRPFDNLAHLRVGQSWRMQLFNPLATLLPGLGSNPIGDSVLVRVTRKETIEHDLREVETFVVESDGVRAWVVEDGRVLRQEVDLPMLGKLTLIDEPYSETVRCARTQDSIP